MENKCFSERAVHGIILLWIALFEEIRNCKEINFKQCAGFFDSS